MGVIEPGGDPDNGNKELADEHAERSPDQQSASSEPLNGVERDWGREHVDQREDESYDKAVFDRPGRF